MNESTHSDFGLSKINTQLGYEVTGRKKLSEGCYVNYDMTLSVLSLYVKNASRIIPEHRDPLRFFYPKEGEEIIYPHCLIVFGVSSRRFLLAAVLSHLLENASSEYSEIVDK
ncbi:hypothetical protein TNCV_4937211 [Trichonephila clavipes]|nr:hypothetical protein TNCV_4937211 [Trichonephila clavipes]